MAPPRSPKYAKLQSSDLDEPPESEAPASLAGLALYDDAPWWVQRVTHGWVAPLLDAGQTKQLGMDDLPRCPKMARVDPLLAAFDGAAAVRLASGARPQPSAGASAGPSLPLLRILVGIICCLPLLTQGGQGATRPLGLAIP
jgi:hypothetical protein